jgi:hypothetical protein
MKYQRFVNKFIGTDGINSEVANEAELDLYFCDMSPVDHAPILGSVDPTIAAESLSLLLQGAWHPTPANEGVRIPL